jgi:AcrR family transcriptional regulator
MARQKPSSTTARRQREFLNRKREILRAARELFIKQGYYNTTLEEIANHAEFGKGTLYNYFASKEELFHGIIDELTAETLSIARRSMAETKGGAREKFTAYGKALITHARANPDLFNIIMREISRLHSGEYQFRLKEIHQRLKRLWQILAQPLREEMRRKMIKPMDSVKLAALFDSMLRIYGMNRFGPFQLLKPDEIDNAVNSIVSIFFDGIAEGKSKG